MDDGANPVTLEDLLHQDDPKAATIAFCMEKELVKLAAAIDEGATPADLERPNWEQHLVH